MENKKFKNTFEGTGKNGEKIIITVLNGKDSNGNEKIFKGKAICQPEDAYNFGFGKKLSKLRALEKKYNYNEKHITKEMDKLLAEYESLRIKKEQMISDNANIQRDIEELVRSASK